MSFYTEVIALIIFFCFNVTTFKQLDGRPILYAGDHPSGLLTRLEIGQVPGTLRYDRDEVKEHSSVEPELLPPSTSEIAKTTEQHEVTVAHNLPPKRLTPTQKAFSSQKEADDEKPNSVLDYKSSLGIEEPFHSAIEVIDSSSPVLIPFFSIASRDAKALVATPDGSTNLNKKSQAGNEAEETFSLRDWLYPSFLLPSLRLLPTNLIETEEYQNSDDVILQPLIAPRTEELLSRLSQESTEQYVNNLGELTDQGDTHISEQINNKKKEYLHNVSDQIALMKLLTTSNEAVRPPEIIGTPVRRKERIPQSNLPAIQDIQKQETQKRSQINKKVAEMYSNHGTFVRRSGNGIG